MAGLNDLVKINISGNGVPAKMPGFGTPLIVDAHDKFSERIRYYSNSDALLEDGFAPNDPAYVAARAAFAQNPQISKVAIGRRVNKPVLALDLIPVAFPSKKYEIEINGVARSFVSDNDPTVAEITAGLTAAIGVVPGFTVTSSPTKITIVATTPGNWCRVKAIDTALIGVKQTHADAGIVADLAAIAIENGDWYGVCLTTASKAEIMAAAAWIESNKRLMFQASQDSEIVNTAAAGATDVAASIKAASYARTGIGYHPDNGAFFDAAAFGRVFPLAPGSATWKFKTLAGVAVVPMTDTQLVNAKDKCANWYTDYAGVPMIAEGWSGAGEYLDVVRDRDWFEAELQFGLFGDLRDNSKIPFTDPGGSVIKARILTVLEIKGVASGFLAADPAPQCSVPKVATISTGKKQARRLEGIKFSGTIAGAIHSLELDGTVTV